MKSLRTLAILVIMVLPPFVSGGRMSAAESAATIATDQIHLLVGRSAVVRTERAIIRVSLSTPDIADAVVTSPREMLVHGKAPGTISLLVWNETGAITNYEVTVRRDLTSLEGQIRAQFPTEKIAVAVNGKDVVLSGVVSAKYVIDRTSQLAQGYVDKPENIVNLLRQQESTSPNQVMLKVRFAEISRTAMQELGVNFFGGPTGADGWMGRSTTGQFPAPIYDVEKSAWIGDFLNLFAFQSENTLGATIQALKGKGLFQSLAEPNLITVDGKEASFLAGGEYPYPVVQGAGVNQSVTIVFKEFGVRLRFTPTLTGGGYINLKVAPEVSTLDFANAVVMEGFRVPALATRRTETEVELRDGQTFAVSGLLDRNMNETLRRVPGIGDIPILGYLFRSQAYQKNNTELVVMITPHIVRRDSPGVTPNLPGFVQPFLAPSERTLPEPPPAFSTPSTAQPGPARTVVSNASPESQPVKASSPSAAAAPTAAAAATTAVAVDPRAEERAKREFERQAKIEADRAKEVARTEAANAAKAAAKQQKETEQTRKAELEQEERDRKAAAEKASLDRKAEERQLAEQAAADRKRWLEQQQQAARAKEMSDRIAKEQARRDADLARIEAAKLEEERKVAEKHEKEKERLAREQSTRDAELERLISQYKKLTTGE